MSREVNLFYSVLKLAGSKNPGKYFQSTSSSMPYKYKSGDGLKSNKIQIICLDFKVVTWNQYEILSMFTFLTSY